MIEKTNSTVNPRQFEHVLLDKFTAEMYKICPEFFIK